MRAQTVFFSHRLEQTLPTALACGTNIRMIRVDGGGMSIRKNTSSKVLARSNRQLQHSCVDSLRSQRPLTSSRSFNSTFQDVQGIALQLYEACRFVFCNLQKFHAIFVLLTWHGCQLVRPRRITPPFDTCQNLDGIL